MDKLESDLVAYIMGLWDQQKRWRLINEYNGAIKLKVNAK